eukprot:GHVT01073400.1.p1 GENE.GHVT01073400.1~~GHVT01073400.1.p1  ORF type:complete len:650 (+),score=134.69 GHVT01073400.1:289-1950(+)
MRASAPFRYSISQLKCLRAATFAMGVPSSIPPWLVAAQDPCLPLAPAVPIIGAYDSGIMFGHHNHSRQMRSPTGMLRSGSGGVEAERGGPSQWRTQAAPHRQDSGGPGDMQRAASGGGALGGFFSRPDSFSRRTPGSPTMGPTMTRMESLPALKRSENSWVAHQMKNKTDETTNITRKLKVILNKLTLEKFDTLYQELLDIGLGNLKTIQEFVKMIFEKATTQHHFIAMYVKLCQKIDTDVVLDNEVGDDGLKDEESHAEGKKKKSQFSRILVNQCQDSFDSTLSPMKIPEGMNEEGAFEFELKYKQKMKGNTIFVGELIKSKLVMSGVVLKLIDELLAGRERCIKDSNGVDMGMHHLEALCVFAQTIGYQFDHPQHRIFNDLDSRFKQMEELSKDKDVAFRVQCLLKDVLDNRRSHWTKHNVATTEGPMTRSELAQKVHHEERFKQMDSLGFGAGGGGWTPHGSGSHSLSRFSSSVSTPSHAGGRPDPFGHSNSMADNDGEWTRASGKRMSSNKMMRGDSGMSPMVVGGRSASQCQPPSRAGSSAFAVRPLH